MKTITKKLSLKTQKQFEIVDITRQVTRIVAESRVVQGIATVFAPHTTAAIKINHHEPLLLQDMMKMLYRLAPVEINYAHDLFEMRANPEPAERSNAHAHLKSFLLNNSESIPLLEGELALSKTQSIFFVELDGGRRRDYIVTIVGE